MKRSQYQGDYEPLRAWALHPSFVRPAGLAQLLCGGMITWLSTVRPLPAAPSHERANTQAASGNTTPLSTLIAVMIAEVVL